MATTWNPSDKSASVTLSGGNEIATVASGNFGFVRATNPFGTKNSCETVRDTNGAAGISTLAFDFSTFTGGKLYFVSPPSGGQLQVYDFTTSTFIGSPVSGTLSAGDRITYELDGTTLYVRQNGSNLIGNAAAGTGGVTISAGTYYPTAVIDATGGSSQTVTLDADSPTYSPSTGYTIIGGGGPVGYTLTAAAGTYAITGQAVPLPVGLVPLNTFQNAAGGTTTATIGTHAAGDLLIAWAFRDGSTTQATLPAGWTSITTRAGTTCAGRLAFKVAASSSETSGTWTNATDLIIAVYRGVDRVGASAVNSGTGNIKYPALTLPSGAAWVLGAAGHRSVNTALETPPTGMTNRRTQVDATDEGALHDTNGIVSSWSSTSVTLGGTSSGWVSIVAELIPKYSGVPAAGYDLAADAGTYALSGVVAVLRVARRLTASAGSYSLTGQAAGLKRGLKVAAAQGGYSLSGVAAGLLAARKVTADPGSYALTGIDATLTYTPATAAYTLTADAGSYSVSGVAAGLRAARRITAAQGTYAITGQAAGLRIARKLVAVQGVYTLSGVAARTFVARRLSAAAGSYVITGRDAALVYTPIAPSYSLTAEAGSYALTGRDAGLAYHAAQPVATPGGGPALSKPARLPFRFRPRREEPIDRSWFNEPQTEEERQRLAEEQAEALRVEAEAVEAARRTKARLLRAKERAEQENSAALLRAVASAERAAYRADIALEIARINALMIDEEDAIALLMAA